LSFDGKLISYCDPIDSRRESKHVVSARAQARENNENIDSISVRLFREGIEINICSS
jgi:hypothetical protein